MVYIPTVHEEKLFKEFNAALHAFLIQWKPELPPAMIIGGLLSEAIDALFSQARVLGLPENKIKTYMVGLLKDLIEKRLEKQ